MQLHEARAFVRSLDLPDLGPQLESAESAGTPVALGSQQEAVAVGAQVTEFSAQVAPAQRAACRRLSAARTAWRRTRPRHRIRPDRLVPQKYVEVLQNVGWTVESLSLGEKQLDRLDLDVHRAIIPVLAEALGPAVAVASIVVGVLKGLQQMDQNKPWITMFDRASEHASETKFQC